MNSQNDDGKASLAAGADSSAKGKGIIPPHKQSGNTSPVGLHMNQTSSANRNPWGASTVSLKAWSKPGLLEKQGISSSIGTGKAYGNNWQAPKTDLMKQVGSGKTIPQSSNRDLHVASIPKPASIPPPLKHGWQWASRGGSFNLTQSKDTEDILPESETDPHHVDSASDDDELPEDSDDEFLSDDSDSDASQKSHETRKRNKWLRPFFEVLHGLTVEQMNEPLRQWHCPACHDGPGAIDWYQGLQPLITHAKTKRTQRAKLHQEFFELLEEELRQRGTSAVPAGELFGKWRGLRDTVTDHAIVWPPMVVIMNTLLEKDENDKYIGMGNQELLEYFDTYNAVKARHSYGPRGHRGMSVLIFELSAVGYLEAERLHKHFQEQGTDREAWARHPVLFYPGGQRQLYGYLACKNDMDIFNQHSHGKSKLKFEMKSYQEMVVSQMKQMSEDNQQLIWLKNKVMKQKQNEKALVETVGLMSNQLRIATEDSRIVRLRSKIQYDENKEEMDYMESFVKDKIDAIRESLEAKEMAFEKLLQEERENAKRSNADSGSNEEHKLREEETAKFINCQSKGIEEFEAEREKLIQVLNDEKNEMKRRHFDEEVDFEKKFDAALTQLMEKYTPRSKLSTSS
ncbi:protein SUPPRESSOR OF GENE SILENCING 3 [Cinnamomum micranthum f. kanehirae]|uniref:Protein SUPPRESSOR OF GENE SILENCING 3 n=1 Tax=Cinnamomum micranthum f. kanehirae TaxID=337451 RepID=A0A443PPK1_9MAGN|nr:protein SUPPRESSOR OF GENE SILENCING 3 [Cinnamomum micranthum f. kanehirae]